MGSSALYYGLLSFFLTKLGFLAITGETQEMVSSFIFLLQFKKHLNLLTNQNSIL